MPGENMDSFVSEVHDLFARLKADDEHFAAVVNPTYSSNAQIINRDAEVVQRLERATHAVMGEGPKEVGAQGHNDADLLPSGYRLGGQFCC